MTINDFLYSAESDDSNEESSWRDQAYMRGCERNRSPRKMRSHQEDHDEETDEETDEDSE
jgi:hypothetical protein